MKPSHTATRVHWYPPNFKGPAMILKLLGIQRLLDELFDDNWLGLVVLVEA